MRRAGLGRFTQAGHQEVATLLLERGAAVSEMTNDGSTTLHYVTQAGNGQLVPLLLVRRAAVNEKDRIGQTALHNAARYGQEEVVALLLERGAAAGERNINGHTALDRAALYGHWEVAPPLEPHRDGRTPLHCAALNGDLDKAKELLEQGAAVNERSDDGRTTLHHASDEGYWEVQQPTNGFNTNGGNATNKIGFPPISFA